MADAIPARALRSEAYVLPGPPAFRTANLGNTLAASGIAPVSRLEHARGLLHRWFFQESGVLTVLNTTFSLFLFALALTMTFIGMQIAQAFGIVVTLNEAANAISPYAGLAFFSLGGLRLLQTALMHDSGRAARMLGVLEACLLLLAGMWAEAVAWYTGMIPGMLKPPLELAGGAITADIVFFSTVVIPFFKPALAAGLGGLLTAKQIKTTAVASNTSRTRWYIALIGLLASAATLIIGMEAGHRHLIGKSDPHTFTATKADLLAKDFGAPFAHGTWCRVSDTFGPRINPFWGTMVPKPVAADGAASTTPAAPVATAAPAAATDGDTALPAKPELVPYSGPRIENHPGVDLAVREGTPVHAMATGTVVYAGFDSGFGNMVALQTKTSSGETTVLNGHMKALNVQSGQSITKGSIIGWVGSTGRSTGPHLHVQVCPQGVAAHGSFKCGTPANPYEVWATLSAIARLSCAQGPAGI